MTAPSDAALAAAFRDWAERLIHKTPEACTEAAEYGSIVRDYVYTRARELDTQQHPRAWAVENAEAALKAAKAYLGLLESVAEAYARAPQATPPKDAGAVAWVGKTDAGLRLASMLRDDVRVGDFQSALADIAAASSTKETHDI